MVAAVVEPAWPRIFAAAAVASVVLIVLAARRTAPLPELRVTADGAVLGRQAQGAESRQLRPLFVSRGLMVLGDGRFIVPVWQDCLAATHYRRLAVACRWGRSGDQALKT